MRRALAIILLLAASAVRADDTPAPPLQFEAGTVLAGGHVLAAAVTLPARPGPVILKLREGADLHWRVTVEHGETRLLQSDGRWAAKAEYHRGTRNGKAACLIYMTIISPEWTQSSEGMVRGSEKPDGADFAPADDRIYAFRETPCP
jgi:hypothetical protein